MKKFIRKLVGELYVFVVTILVCIAIIPMVAIGVVLILWLLFSVFGPGDLLNNGTRETGTTDPSYAFCQDIVDVNGHVIGYISDAGDHDVKRFLSSFQTPDQDVNRLAHLAAQNFDAGTFPDLPNAAKTPVVADQEMFFAFLDEAPTMAQNCFKDLKQGVGSVSQLYAAME